MAFIDQNRFEDEDQDLLNRDQQISTGAGQQSAAVTGGEGTRAGVGAGGTGGWTNIQAYLNANKADTGSAQALQNQVGQQFGQEKTKMGEESSKFLSDAQKQVDSSSIKADQAQSMLDNAAQWYNYSGPQSEDYQKTTDQFRNALTSQYTGPREYAYGFQDKTQQYGEALTNPGGFDQVMNEIYSKSAKAPLAPGAFNLQKQLDVNNVALAQAKDRLAKDYENLGKEREQVVTNTTGQLSGLADQFRRNQTSLNDWLYGKGNEYQTAIDKAEADARSAYDKSFREDKSGRKATGYDNINARAAQSGTTGIIAQGERSKRAAADIWGNDMTYERLQREQDVMPKQYPYGWNYGTDFQDNLAALNQFYTTQDEKYANTADAEERRWNAIQDFLNSNLARKEQGFKVRG